MWGSSPCGHASEIKKLAHARSLLYHLFRHPKGNFPESCLVETCTFQGTDEESKAAFADGGSGLAWKTLLKRTKCVANDQRTYGKEDLSHAEAFTHVRLTIFPDGGVSRLRLWCTVAR